jgi:Flp pilus assembly protein TadB
MTVDPGTPEGQRRTRRGLRVGRAASMGVGVVGLLLVTAVREQTVALWVTWAVVLVAIVAAFVFEFRRERARRRRDGTPLT